MGLMEDPGSMGPMQGFGALGPIWGGASGRPKADITEAEGRLNGGLGAEPPRDFCSSKARHQLGNM